MAIKNTGGSAIDLAPINTNVVLSFGPPTGWSYSTSPTLSGGGTTLSGGETDSVTFTVTTTGSTPGDATIMGQVTGTETNSQQTRFDDTSDGGTGTITLQTPAALVIDSVTPSRTTVTQGTSVPWDVTVAVRNGGGSAIQLVLPSTLNISIDNASVQTVFAPANGLLEGGVQLDAGSTGTLLLHTTATGTFMSPGLKTVGVSVPWTEINSGRTVSTDATGAITIQNAPNLTVATLEPDTVTSGAMAMFRINVTNPGANAATVTLDRGSTRVHFDSYGAFLDLASPATIAGGGTKTLIFEDKPIDPAIVVGQHDFITDLAYTANAVPSTETETLVNGLTIQSAPQLAINGIATSQGTVTAGQTTPWTVTMAIANNGAAAIDLDFASNKTKLTFVKPGGGEDTTYLVQRPTALANGDTILAPNTSGTIDFKVNQTGTTPGDIVINGRVEGRDLNLSQIVFDDTFDGGRGSITVQSAAAVAVTAIHTSQPKVTAGQTAPWDVRAVLHNSGTAGVNVDLAASHIDFNGLKMAGATLVGGGSTLSGGATDSLLFQVTQTGVAGSPRIDATVPWIEPNTSHVDSSRTTVSGFGHVTVQTPPVLRITTTSTVAANTPNVNTNQNFSVAVQVQNTGQADARDVALGMTSNGSSAIPVIPSIPSIPGGQTVPVSLPVTASGTAASELFTTRLNGATDVNSGQNDLATLATALDSTTTAVIQTPAGLDITTVRASQASVTQGQSNAWSVTVALHNTGGADVDLTPPAASNLSFMIAGGGTQIDYVVQPPTTFGSGAPGWRLAGGAVDSLVYTIASTGSEVGTLNIDASEAGTDRNQPTLPVSDTGTTSVSVQPVAGLSIASTVGVGTVNHANANRDTVNTNFAYEIDVTVQNTGETVDSVLVDLQSDDHASSIQRASDIRQSIDANASHEFVFRITAPGTPDALETFTASILPGVKSHNSGQPVTPQPPVDNLHVVVTEGPANLVATLGISAPPGAKGGFVSPSQVFTIAGKVTNTGDAGLASTIGVTLTPPGGFVVTPPLVRTAAPGDSVKWTVTAPSTQQASQNFVVAITTTPNDRNTGAPANVQTGTAQVGVTVSAGGALASPGIAITSPAGAVDGTVSATQQFVVHATVTPSSDTQNIVATLTASGFQIVGSSVFNMGNGTGAQKSHDYTVNAPSLPSTAAPIFVTFTGTDKNSGLPVPSSTDTVMVTTVARANLSVSALVTAPPDATDNTVSVGTPFTVSASVTNVAGAAGLATAGTLTMTLPAGYTFASGQTAAKSFTTATPVTWQVNAAPQPTGPEQIRIDITGVPPDENSGLPAVVTTGTATIAMVTEGSAVAVSDVSSSANLAEDVAPAGATGLNLLAFRIAYNATDSNVPAAEIDTIAVTVVDKDGKPLGPGTVAQTLARVTVDLGGAQPYEVVNPSTNPVVLSVLAGGSDRTIPPNTFATAIVGVDLKANPKATQFKVGLRSGGLVVRDPQSGQPLSVTDTQGRLLDGQITSKQLVVLSSNFAEYAHNYPNPFRAGSEDTRIAYVLDKPTTVNVKIYSMAGDLVWEETIPNGDARAQAGPQETKWNGRNGNGDVVRNGLYICVLNAGSKSTKFRIAVAK